MEASGLNSHTVQPETGRRETQGTGLSKGEGTSLWESERNVPDFLPLGGSDGKESV